MTDIGWSLIHFSWQGLLLAALLNTILPLCHDTAARHNCALATLGMMALAPITTFLIIHGFGNLGTALSGTAASTPAPWVNWLVMFWLAGVATLSLRALIGWHLVQSLTRRDVSALPAELSRRCHDLQRRLAVAWPVRFLLSHRIEVPMVIGWLKPVILIPASAFAGLAPQQLDALISHELAHIRRFDTVTNVLLIAAETVLFYHPAVWWVSRQVRTEREHCCDDLAISVCGDVAMYVEALTSLEARKATVSLALAANGGRLKTRVARLLGAPVQSSRVSLFAMAGLALIGLVLGSVAMAQPRIDSQHGQARTALGITELQPIQETHTLPPYPKESVHLKEQGRVLLGVTIGTDGAVSRAVVVGPSGHQRLDIAAAQFVKSHWRWQPAMRAGKPVAMTTRVGVVFKLKHPEAQ